MRPTVTSQLQVYGFKFQVSSLQVGNIRTDNNGQTSIIQIMLEYKQEELARVMVIALLTITRDDREQMVLLREILCKRSTTVFMQSGSNLDIVVRV